MEPMTKREKAVVRAAMRWYLANKRFESACAVEAREGEHAGIPTEKLATQASKSSFALEKACAALSKSRGRG